MKILAFTDHHGSPDDMKKVTKKAEGADIIVCAGDFTIFEHEIEHVLEQMNQLPKKVIFIHGNHEAEETVEMLADHYENLEFIHQDHIEIDGVLFMGYGGGGFSERDADFEHFSKKLPKLMKGKKTVLMVHGPPHGNKLDLIAGDHVGNKSFADFIKKHKPDVVVFGHLHEHFSKKDKHDKTLLINPGPEGEIIELE